MLRPLRKILVDTPFPRLTFANDMVKVRPSFGKSRYPYLMKNSLLIAAVCALSSLGYSQTVTVDGTSAPPTNYPTITAALLSFDSGTSGPNAGNLAPNVINVTTFGPHDVRIPVLGTGAVTLIGAAVQVVDGTEGFSIIGVGIKPLILVQNNEVSTGDGIVIQNGATNTFENLIMAPSPTGAAVGDDLIYLIGTNSRLDVIDSVITCLPAASATYTSIGDIPAGLLDGSAVADATVIRTGDNGVFVGAAGNTNVVLNFNNSVIAQQGGGGTPDGFVLSAGAVATIGAGSVVSATTRLGVQVSSITASLTVAGTLQDPVLFLNHNNVTNGDALRPFGANGPIFSVDHAIFNNNTVGINVFTGASLDLATFSVTNSVFSNNLTGFIVGDDGTGTTPINISDNTFHANGVGLLINAPVTPRVVSITDCIFSGAGTGINANDTVTVTLNNSALVGAGPDALTTAIVGGALLTQTPAAITADPAYALSAYTFGVSRDTPDNYLQVTALAYLGAGSSSIDLTGGGTSNITAPLGAANWSLYN